MTNWITPFMFQFSGHPKETCNRIMTITATKLQIVLPEFVLVNSLITYLTFSCLILANRFCLSDLSCLVCCSLFHFKTMCGLCCKFLFSSNFQLPPMNFIEVDPLLPWHCLQKYQVVVNGCTSAKKKRCWTW